MDQKPNQGFRYWFENVFKFHYGKLSLVLLILAAVFVFTIIETAKNKITYDFHLAVIVSGSLSRESLSELEQLTIDTVGDLNGDGEVNVDLQILNMLVDPLDRLVLLMAQPEFVVFIMDEQLSSVYKNDFNDLKDYGITYDQSMSTRVFIGDSPLMKRITQNIRFYACLADWTTDGKGKDAWTEAGVRLIGEILNSK
jgi:hypothetical protein